MNSSIKEQRCAEIDNLAASICTLMPANERDDFFDYQDARFKSKEGFNKRYHAGRFWYKGDRKGQLKDVYIVDGAGFNKLWELLVPFATTVVNGFFRTRAHITGDHLDILSDIKYQTLYVLRFQGPIPYKSGSFSVVFPLICKNIVSNANAKMYGVKDKEITEEEAREFLSMGKPVKYAIPDSEEDIRFSQYATTPPPLKLHSLNSQERMDSLLHTQDKVLFFKYGVPGNKTKINFLASHLHDSIMEEYDDDSEMLTIHKVGADDFNLNSVEWLTSAPTHLKDAITGILDGMTVKEAAEIAGISRKELKSQLKMFANVNL